MRELTFDEIDLVSGAGPDGNTAVALAILAGVATIVAAVSTAPVSIVASVAAGGLAIGAAVYTFIDQNPPSNVINQPMPPPPLGASEDGHNGSYAIQTTY